MVAGSSPVRFASSFRLNASHSKDSTVARRSEHSLAEIKTMVLNSAASIIADEGFNALTIRKIAMEMGYTVGSVYMVFESRADIVLHLNAQTLDEISTELAEVSDLTTWLKHYIAYINSHSERWYMVFNPNSIDLPDWYQAHQNHLFQQFAVFFKLPETEILVLWQALHGICLLSDADNRETSVLSLFNLIK